MNITSRFSLTISALALTLAPTLAIAKNARISPITGPGMAHCAPHQINKTSTGSFDSTKFGAGTYTRTVTGTKGDLSSKTVFTLSDGKTYTRTSTDVRTVNADGSTSFDVTTHLANGAVITKTLTSTGTSGDYTVTGTSTSRNGAVDQISGTRDQTAYGTQSDVTVTNSSGKTASVDNQILRTGDAAADVTTGTGFKGQNIASASVWTISTSPSSNSVATTQNGQGTYIIGSSQNGTVQSVTSTRTYTNGTTSSSDEQITPNADGSTSYTKTNSASYPSGTNSSTTVSDTYTPGTNGVTNISGTFTQSDGTTDYHGPVTGTQTATGYGYDTNLLYAQQNGTTKTVNTQTLRAGDAVLNVTTGTGYAGLSPSSSAGLVTGPGTSIPVMTTTQGGV